jgi:hypothetical protein
VKEVLRVRPVLSATPRQAVAPYTVGDWTLPAGTHVTPCPYLAHRRAEHWPEPTAFRPERFLDGAPEPFSWLPFGGGTRRCAGAAFATMELKAVLGEVVAAVDLRPDRRRASVCAAAVSPSCPRGAVASSRRRAPVRNGARPGTCSSVSRRAMTSLFCRHNRLTAKCPICSKEMEAELRAKAPPRAARARPAPAARSARARSARTPGGVVTRRMARAQDDGYRNPLVPGLRATADAERLAGALVDAARRLEPPGPYEAVAAEPDLEQATWLAFLLALIGPERPTRRSGSPRPPPRWEDGDLRASRTRRARHPLLPPVGGALRIPGGGRHRRAGLDAAAALRARVRAPRAPGLTRAARFEYVATLGAAELYPLEADALELGVEDDAATLAAKRVCSRATACCSSGVRATWRPPPSCRSRARPRPGGVGDARCPRRPDGGAAGRGPRGALAAMSTAVGSRPLDLADLPAPAAGGAPGRAGRAPRARLPGRSRRSPTRCPRADLRPVGVDHRGAARSPLRPRTRARARRGSRCRCCSRRRSRCWRRRRARAVARGRAGGRLLAFAFTYRLGGARWPAGRGRDRPRGSCWPTSSSATSRAATPRAARRALPVGVERHLDGRRTEAFLLGVAGGLLRPELWPFLLLYGLWLMWVEPRRRWLVLGCGRAHLALWFLPEWWGSGDPSRAAARARDPTPTRRRSPTTRSWRRSGGPRSS